MRGRRYVEFIGPIKDRSSTNIRTLTTAFQKFHINFPRIFDSVDSGFALPHAEVSDNSVVRDLHRSRNGFEYFKKLGIVSNVCWIFQNS